MNQTISAPVRQCIKNINNKNNPEYDWIYDPTNKTLQHVKSEKCLLGTANSITMGECAKASSNHQIWDTTNNQLHSVNSVNDLNSYLAPTEWDYTTNYTQLDPTNKWVFLSDGTLRSALGNMGGGSCLRYGDNGGGRIQLSVNHCRPDDLDIKWTKNNDGYIIHNKTGLCLDNTDGTNNSINLKKCNFDQFNPGQWEFKNGNLQNLNTGNSLDGNGLSVYWGDYAPDNIFKNWTMPYGNTSKIIHKSDNKCLNVDGSNNLVYSICDSNAQLKTDSKFRSDYINAVNSITNICNNQSSFCYNDSNNCSDILNNSDTIDNKILDWCVSNSEEAGAIDLCIKYTNDNYKLNDLYINKLCSSNNNIADNIFCKYITAQNTSDNDLVKLFKAELNDNLTLNWCNANNHFISLQKNWKYTDDKFDPECLNNWTFYDTDGKTIIADNIPNLTTLHDTKNWCPTRRPNTNDNFICNAKLNKYNYKNLDLVKYNTINTLWKSLGCTTNLPINIFLRVFKMSISDQTTFLQKFFNNSNYFANNLCHGGNILNIDDILLPNQCLYSQNKKYKLCLNMNGDLNVIQVNTGNILYTVNNKNSNDAPYLIMQSDRNLVLYDSKGAVWASNTQGGISNYAIMQNDGSFVINDIKGNLVVNYNKNIISDTSPADIIADKSKSASISAFTDLDLYKYQINISDLLILILLFIILILLIKYIYNIGRKHKIK